MSHTPSGGPILQHERYPDAYHDSYSRTTFGVWLYLLTDFVMFGALFATYGVLMHSTFGGPTGRLIFNIPYAHAETLILLTSSFTVGLGAASAHRRNKKMTLLFFAITFLLGVIFTGMQIDEFIRFAKQGAGWQRSAFLSGYFTLVGTHAVHMVFILLFLIILVAPVTWEGITPVSIRRLTCLKMFWQFLNIVWVFIFSFVYLMGVY